MSVGLVEKLRAQREHRVEVLPGKFIRYRRPLEAEMAAFKGGITLELVCGQVVGWDLTEADLLPPGVGSSDPAPFSADAAREVLGDRSDWFGLIVDSLVQVLTDYWARKADVAKN